MTFPEAYRRYLSRYDTPHNDFHINLIRILVCLYFAWKTLSRDFGFMGIIPEDFFYLYPIEIYHPSGIILTTGIPVLMEIVTMHWVHWITGFPSETALYFLQATLASLFMLTAFAGRGPRRIFAISSYLLATYLWGFIFLSGQEIDAVTIYFGILLVLCLARYNDQPVWRMRQVGFQPANVPAGQAFSAILLVFVVYYGLSGYNKIADVSLIEWFGYELSLDIENTARMQSLGYFFGAPFPGLYGLFIGHWWIDYIFVPFVYVSHLSIFLMFFLRRHIPKFIMFYTAFHFITMSVSIAFTGYLFVWWLLLDWRKLLFGSSPQEKAFGTR